MAAVNTIEAIIRMNTSHLPDSNGSPARYKGAALPDELRWRSTWNGIRTHTAGDLNAVPPAIGLPRLIQKHNKHTDDNNNQFTDAEPEQCEPLPGVEPGTFALRMRRSTR